MNENPYIVFEEQPSKGKTVVLHVRSRRTDDLLGSIRWYGAWRQYTLWVEPQTIWNTGCLEAVNERIRGLMQERWGP
jgi:hypothetical protein